VFKERVNEKKMSSIYDRCRHLKAIRGRFIDLNPGVISVFDDSRGTFRALLENDPPRFEDRVDTPWDSLISRRIRERCELLGSGPSLRWPAVPLKPILPATI
jgi:hypothetical protein